MNTEIKHKIKKVHGFLETYNIDGMLISRQDNFAWVTGGKRNYVGLATELGVASLLVTKNKIYVITNNIETPRIKNEEFINFSIKCEFKTYNWWQDYKKQEIIKKLISRKKIGSDDNSSDTVMLKGEFAKLRYSLTPEEIQRYKDLGQICGISIAQVCKSIKPGYSEYEVAGMMSNLLIKNKIDPVVLLIASDERIFKYRNPLPTDKKIDKYVMVVIGARICGLIASVTRLVYFGKINSEVRRKHSAVVKVDANMINVSKPQAKVSEILKKAKEIYKETGFANEWKLHHQGGTTGYAPRDYKAIPDSNEVLYLNQAVAWNPSITGTKSEDTIIVGVNHPEIITVSPDWPLLKVEIDGNTIKRSDILISR